MRHSGRGRACLAVRDSRWFMLGAEKRHQECSTKGCKFPGTTCGICHEDFGPYCLCPVVGLFCRQNRLQMEHSRIEISRSTEAKPSRSGSNRPRFAGEAISPEAPAFLSQEPDAQIAKLPSRSQFMTIVFFICPHLPHSSLLILLFRINLFGNPILALTLSKNCISNFAHRCSPALLPRSSHCSRFF